MGSVGGEQISVCLAFFRKFKKELAALVIPFEERLCQNVPLGQKKAVFAGVAVGSRCLDTVCLIHVA